MTAKATADAELRAFAEELEQQWHRSSLQTGDADSTGSAAGMPRSRSEEDAYEEEKEAAYKVRRACFAKADSAYPVLAAWMLTHQVDDWSTMQNRLEFASHGASASALGIPITHLHNTKQGSASNVGVSTPALASSQMHAVHGCRFLP